MGPATWNLAPDLVAAQGGSASVDASSGIVSYAPEADFNGSGSFAVRGTDAYGDSANITVIVTVEAVNRAPVVEGEGSVLVTMSDASEPTPFALDLGAADVEEGPLAWSLDLEFLAQAQHGSAAVGADTGVVTTYHLMPFWPAPTPSS